MRTSLTANMADKAKMDVESGLVGQSLVDTSKSVNVKVVHTE